MRKKGEKRRTCIKAKSWRLWKSEKTEAWKTNMNLRRHREKGEFMAQGKWKKQKLWKGKETEIWQDSTNFWSHKEMEEFMTMKRYDVRKKEWWQVTTTLDSCRWKWWKKKCKKKCKRKNMDDKEERERERERGERQREREGCKSWQPWSKTWWWKRKKNDKR